MDNMYKTIAALCEKNGISVAAMCRDLGMNQTVMSDLKHGRTKFLSAKRVAAIADYFGVSSDYLFGIGNNASGWQTDEAQKEKAPTQTGERSDDELTIQILEALKNADREQREAILTLLTKK